MTDEIRAAGLRMYAAFNAHDHAAATELFTLDFFSHPLGTTGPHAVAESWTRFHDTYPGARVTVEDMIVEGDTVAARLTVHGVGDRPATMLEMYRVRDGRISELWALSSLSRPASRPR